jgi:hypothetical protein
MGRDRVTIYSRNEYPEDRSERTEEKIRKLNDLATTVIERYYEMTPWPGETSLRRSGAKASGEGNSPSTRTGG